MQMLYSCSINSVTVFKLLYNIRLAYLLPKYMNPDKSVVPIQYIEFRWNSSELILTHGAGFKLCFNSIVVS